jgi:hypothetical protein
VAGLSSEQHGAAVAGIQDDVVDGVAEKVGAFELPGPARAVGPQQESSFARADQQRDRTIGDARRASRIGRAPATRRRWSGSVACSRSIAIW